MVCKQPSMFAVPYFFSQSCTCNLAASLLVVKLNFGSPAQTYCTGADKPRKPCLQQAAALNADTPA